VDARHRARTPDGPAAGTGREPGTGPDEPRRIDLRAARNTARHLVEGWALEASRRRKLAEDYREHLVALRTELAGLQRANGLDEHDCPICTKAGAGPDTGDVPL
jgi:hypothetical protein